MLAASLPLRLSRRMLRALARLLIGTLLFAQFAVAAHACAQMAADPAMATSIDARADEGDDSTAERVCAEHCKAEPQGDTQHGALATPAPVRSLLHRLLPPPPSDAPRRTVALLNALTPGAPPHAILHCVFRI